MAGGGMMARMKDSQNESVNFVFGVLGPMIDCMR
jgi:hypothetical protein